MTNTDQVIAHVLQKRANEELVDSPEEPTRTQIAARLLGTIGGGVAGYSSDMAEIRQRRKQLDDAVEELFALRKDTPKTVKMLDYVNQRLNRKLPLAGALIYGIAGNALGGIAGDAVEHFRKKSRNGGT